jgi:D-lactate dehydrogenase
MNRIKVAMFDSKPYDREFFEKVNTNEKKFGFDIHYFTYHLNEDTAPLTDGFDAVCVFVNDMVTSKVASVLVKNHVRLLALRSAGFNNVDLKAAYKKLHVVRVPAYSPHAVAEHAVALMMALNRKTHRAYFRTRENNFSISGLLGFDMFGKTVGIVGTGKIGKALTGIMKGFGMRVLAFDVYPDREFESKGGIEYVDLDTLYRESDIISLHCPLTPENVNMINKNSISRMKKGVMIINTGRGKLINTRDLIEGLKSYAIGSAGLDVYEEEGDYFFEDFSAEPIGDDVLARLMTFPNVIVTSHQAFFTREALESIIYTTLENVRLFFEDGQLPNEICYKCEGGV